MSLVTSSERSASAVTFQTRTRHVQSSASKRPHSRRIRVNSRGDCRNSAPRHPQRGQDCCPVGQRPRLESVQSHRKECIVFGR